MPYSGIASRKLRVGNFFLPKTFKDGNLDHVRFLLFQLGLRCNELDERNDLPLDLALTSKQTSIAKTLLEHKAKVNQCNHLGWSLLHIAVERGDASGFTFSLLITQQKEERAFPHFFSRILLTQKMLGSSEKRLERW